MTTALVGASGAGKTTIVNLLLRLYAPDSGRILVDGVDLADLQRSDWLALLAVAGQDIDLIEGTVRDNILMARPGGERSGACRSRRVAGLAELVAALPNGYEHWIGQEGLEAFRRRASTVRARARRAARSAASHP